MLAFYNPTNPAAQQSMGIAREAGRTLGLQILERQVTSVDALRVALQALKATDADAICYVADAMVNSQSQLVIDSAIGKALPTMFAAPENAVGGALASYGVSYYTFGRRCARQVQRVLQGTRPADLPVEQIEKLHFAINLRTAKALRLTMPASVLARADQVIE